MNESKPIGCQQALAQQRAQLIVQVQSGLLSAQDAARQLQISRKTYYKWEHGPWRRWSRRCRIGNMDARPCPSISDFVSFLVKDKMPQTKERQLLLFMLRFVLGYFTAEHLQRHLRNKLPSKDLHTLYSYMTGVSRCKRIRALIVIFHLHGVPNDSIASGLGIYHRTVRRNVRIYRRFGIDALFPSRNGVVKWESPEYKDALFGILHSPPTDHGF
jgi:transposase